MEAIETKGEQHVNTTPDGDPPAPRVRWRPTRLINLCTRGGSGDVGEARDLIARGINIDEQDRWGRTALMHTVVYNRPEIVKELIRAGAALDLQNENCNTALIYAVRRNHIEIVKELVRAGAAPDLQGSDGKTALQIANDNECTETATLLEGAMD